MVCMQTQYKTETVFNADCDSTHSFCFDDTFYFQPYCPLCLLYVLFPLQASER